ncbi:MAG TPA: DUF4332 domain-containing protein [Acidobacteriota bacterium]|nr:DUF4332 domain-containing protein [Acidobacteriota bacterium]
MTYPMRELQWIQPEEAERLRRAGIESTDDMLRLWADAPKRAGLAEKAGLPVGRLAELEAMSRLARVKNVGPKYVGMLLAAGIDGPNRLFDHTAEALVKRLLEMAVEKKLMSRVPTVDEVRPWYPEPNPVIATVK